MTISQPTAENFLPAACVEKANDQQLLNPQQKGKDSN
jgi:hypothetical protein